MADEVNNPTPIDPENPPEAIEEIEGETIRELREVPVETIPTDELDPVATAIKEDEPPKEREERREVEAELNKPIEAIEDKVNALDMQDQQDHDALANVLPHIIPDTTLVFGRVVPLPVYTVVYITLAVITAIEVLITGFPHGFLLTITLLGLSIAKMVLVVLFYMHLREDSKLFAAAIILPLFIITVATLFLIAVPSTGY